MTCLQVVYTYRFNRLRLRNEITYCEDRYRLLEHEKSLIFSFSKLSAGSRRRRLNRIDPNLILVRPSYISILKSFQLFEGTRRTILERSCCYGRSKFNSQPTWRRCNRVSSQSLLSLHQSQFVLVIRRRLLVTVYARKILILRARIYSTNHWPSRHRQIVLSVYPSFNCLFFTSFLNVLFLFKYDKPIILKLHIYIYPYTHIYSYIYILWFAKKKPKEFLIVDF